MKFRSLALLPLLVAAFGGTALAQPSSNVYEVQAQSQAFVPLTGGVVTGPGVTMPSGEPAWAGTFSEGSITVPFGFTFPYYGKNYTAVRLNTNGFLILLEASPHSTCTTSGTSCFNNRIIPGTATSPHAFIAPWWDDLEGRTAAVAGTDASEIRYVKTATELAVEYKNFGYFDAPALGIFSFQVRIRSNGTFTVNYGSHTGTGKTTFGASNGFENDTGSEGGTLFSCNTAADCKYSTTTASNDWPTNMQFTVGAPVKPELIVTAVTHTAPTDDGTSLKFDVTPVIKNVGQGSASSFTWKAYLSADKTLDATDRAVFTSASKTIAGGGSLTETASVSVSGPNPPAGSYYVLVEADAGKVVNEFLENNNATSAAASFMHGSDLVAVSVSGPASAGSGSTISVPVRIRNLGTKSVTQLQVKVFLSSDKTFSSGDLAVFTGRVDVAAGATVDATASITLGRDIPEGDQYLIAQLDSEQAVPELSESNNEIASSSTIKITFPDLAIEGIEFLDPVTELPTRKGYFGQTARVQIKYRNIGGVATTGFHVGLAISRDSSLSLLPGADLLFHHHPVPGLPATSALQTVEFNVTLPLLDARNNPFATSNYFFFGIVNSKGDVSEAPATQGNGWMGVVEPVFVRAPSPDYAVAKVDAPATGAVGEIIPVFRVLKNIGNLDGTKVTYRYVASANDIITSDDIGLQMLSSSGALADSGDVTLAVNEESRTTEFIKLPAHMPASSYYVGVIIDGANQVSELDELNNAGGSLTKVQVAGASMRILTQQLPDAISGRPFNFRLVAVGAQEELKWEFSGADRPPEGITLSQTDGTLIGTASTPTVKAFTVTATTLSNTQQAVARLVLRVLPTSTELSITSSALPPMINSPNQQYQGTLGAAGGVKPYTWKITSGTLPTGVLFHPDGTFSGAPRTGTVVGESMLSFEVLDSLGNRATSQLRLRIVAPNALVISNLTVQDAMVNQSYVADLQAENADGTSLPDNNVQEWSVVAGVLPPGLTLTTLQGKRGLLEGTPNVPGTYPFSIQVRDSDGRTDVADFVVRVFPTRFKVTMPADVSSYLPGEAVQIQLLAEGSSPNPKFRLYSGTLPAGLTLSEQGVIAGTLPDDVRMGSYAFLVEARDDKGGIGVGALSLDVSTTVEAAGCSASGGSTGFWALALLMAPVMFARRRKLAAVAVTGALALAVVPGVASAQTVLYSAGPVTASQYVPMSGGASASVTDTVGVDVTLPFTFSFYGSPYDTVRIHQRGYIAFSADATVSSNRGIPGTSTAVPQTFIAPWWDDLRKGTNPVAVVKFQTSGTAPNRVFTVEWKDMLSISSTTGRFSFQAQLFETSNKIQFNYGPAAPAAGGSASVGIQKTAGTGATAGVAGLTACTTASSGTCSATHYPGGPTTSYPQGSRIEFTLPPELEPIAVGGDDTGYAGMMMRGTATVRNNGGRRATSVRVAFVLSSDNVMGNGDDHELGISAATNIDVNASATVEAAGQVPANRTPGTYFLFARVDPTNAVPESNETNNDAPPTLVKIGPPTADLVVNGITAPATAAPGATLNITRTLYNAGSADATGPIRYTYYLSDNSVVSFSDRPLASFSRAGLLGPAASDNGSDGVQLPSELNPGKYWLGVCVDYDPNVDPTSTVAETSEVNNCLTAPAGTVVSTGSLMVVTSTLPSGARYSPYGIRLEASGGDGAYVWSQVSGQLPAGLTLNSSGDLAGTPGATGAFSFEVKVTSATLSATKSLQVSIQETNIPLTVVDQDLPAAEFAAPYQIQLVAVGGTPPYTWSIKQDSRLPIGLALSRDGVVEGQAKETGDIPFIVELTDQAGTKVAKDLHVNVVNPVGLRIATTRLSLALLKREYVQVLHAVGGKAPYSWTIAKVQRVAENSTDVAFPPEDSLPSELNMTLERDSSGSYLLRGTPSLAGQYAVTFRVEDATGTADVATLLLQVSANEALALTTTALPDAFLAHPYTARLSHNARPGTAQVKFTVPCVQQVQSSLRESICTDDPGQALPPGMKLLEDGSFEGIPALPEGGLGESNAKTYNFLVKISDETGRQDVRSLSIKLRPDYSSEGGGCSGTGFGPSGLALLALAGLTLRGWRRRNR